MKANKEQISLFVAEKPSVAKEIAAILSKGKNNKVSEPFWLIPLVFWQIKVQPNIWVRVQTKQSAHQAASHFSAWSYYGAWIPWKL